MKRPRKIALVIGGVLFLVLVGLTTVIILGPPGPSFVCHRLLDGALQQWMLDTTNGVTYPNVDGSSSRSLALVIPYIDLHDTNVLHDYMYVPGIRTDDPDNLILFYLRAPSRRTWHGDLHWFSGPKRWVVINPRMSSPDSNCGRTGGEVCEAISMPEFRDRLRATLNYLKRNERPGWQTAEQEHMRFVSTILE